MKDNFEKLKNTISKADLEYVELRCFDLMKLYKYNPEIVSEPPQNEKQIIEQLLKLKPEVNPGIYKISDPNEQKIHQKRINAINRVLSRRL